MASTESFLISLGIDPADIKAIATQYRNLKGSLEGDPIKLSIEVPDDLGGLKDVGADAAAAFKKADEAAAQMEDGLRGIVQGLDQMKAGIIAIGAASALFAGKGFANAAEESRNLARANVILGDSQEQLALKQQDLRQIANDVGLSYKEVSAALFDVVSAGFEGETAVAAIRAAAQAAVPAGTDVATAFNAIATAQVNFGLTSEEAADKLVRTADLSRASLENVSAALGRIAPAGKQLGVSLEEIGAAFATITLTGESADEASTLLFNTIQKFVAPSAEAAVNLERIGITTGDAAFKTQTLAEKIQILATAAQEGRIELSQTFDQRAFRGVVAIAGNLDTFQQNLSKIGDSAGRTKAGLDSFFSSAGPQWDKFTTAVDNAATAMGEDLLLSLQDTLEWASQFITNNQELIGSFTKLGLAVAGLTAGYYGLKLVAGPIQGLWTVLSGASKLIQAAFSQETGTLYANTTAWIANKAAKAGDLWDTIVKGLKAVWAALNTENQIVWANIKAWAAKIALKLGKALEEIVNAIGRLILGIAQETRQLWSNTTAATANAAAQTSLRGKLNSLAGAFGKNVSSAGAATTVFGLVGAAIAGWQIGSAINDWLELEKATANYVKTGESSWKTTLANVVTFGQLSRDRARAKKAIEESSKLTERETEFLKSQTGAMERYNRFMKLGAASHQAFAAAVGDSEDELRLYERAIEKGNKLTAEEVLYVQQLREEVKKLREERDTAARTYRTNAAAIAEAQKTLTNGQAEWEKSVEATNAAYDKLKIAPIADSAEDIKAFATSFDQTASRLKAANVLMEDLLSQREELNNKKGQQFLKDLKAWHASYLSAENTALEARRKLEKDIQLVEAKILANGKIFIDGIKASSADEIRIRREAVAELIATEQKLYDESKALWDKLTAERDRQVANVDAFIQKLQDAETQRRDPALLEIIRLEREYSDLVKEGIPDQERRAASLELIGRELARLAKATQAEITLQEQLAKLNDQIANQQTGGDTATQEEQLKLLQERERVEKQLTEQVRIREERTAFGEKVLKEAQESSSKALTTFAQKQRDIDEAYKQREESEAKLKSIAADLAKEQQKIEDRLKGQVAQAKALVAAQLQSVVAVRELTRMRTTGEIGAVDFSNQFAEAVSALKKGFQDVAKLSVADIEQSTASVAEKVNEIAGESKAAADFLDTVNKGLQSVDKEFADKAAQAAAAAATASDTLTSLPDSLDSSTNALSDMVDAANELAPKMKDYAEEATSKLTEAAGEIRGLGNDLGALREEVRRIKVSSGGGANGLPR